MSRTRKMPTHDFTGMSAEEIADLVEEDIKSLARKWKYAHSKATRMNIETAATETGAFYLQANHALYFQEDRQAHKDAHQHWMELMRSWFLSVFERKVKA